MAEQVRVRFAPSPTGYLHIGGLRTALFNYLFAAKSGGVFVLRIEDTDRTRFVPEALEDIKKGLRWLGLEWQEGPDCGGPHGPYIQSERSDLYREQIQILLDQGAAYRCFCTEAELEAMRTAQQESGQPVMYDRRCRSLSSEESAGRAARGESHVIRFAIPADGETVVSDRLRGEVRFENIQLDDFILIKSDGMPTYHFANVVDDHDMRISHVLRGEEWISSTPKHILLYQAFGWTPPVFVHLPVILSPGGGKLSKRDGATRVYEFVEKGYLAEAMINFLALLGWSLDGETHHLEMAQLKEVFDLERIGLTSPVFDLERLNDLNGKYIRRSSIDALLPEFMERLKQYDPDAAFVKQIIPLVQERLTLLSEIPERCSFFFEEELEYGDGSILLPKKTGPEDMTKILLAARAAFNALDLFEAEQVEQALRGLVAETGYKPGQVFMGLRACLTGTMASPELFPTIAVLGKSRCLARIDRVLQLLQEPVL